MAATPGRAPRSGEAYRLGSGVPRDFAQALMAFERGCTKGEGKVPACLGLAELHREGSGVDKDEARALTILDTACTGDEPSCCAHLGLLHVEGLSVPFNITQQRKGVLYYEKACGLGWAGACWHLGLLYRAGDCPRRREEGPSVFSEKACDAGDSVACAEIEERPGDKHP